MLLHMLFLFFGVAHASVGPAWTFGAQEPPQGEKDMGGWIAAVYTAEQMERLGIDENGAKAPNEAMPGSCAKVGEPCTSSKSDMGAMLCCDGTTCYEETTCVAATDVAGVILSPQV